MKVYQETYIYTKSQTKSRDSDRESGLQLFWSWRQSHSWQRGRAHTFK